MPSTRRAVERLEPLARPRVRGDDDACPQRSCTACRQSSSMRKRVGRVDVLLAVGADEEVAAAARARGVQDVRGLDLRTEVLQHLPHGRAGQEDAPGVQPLGEQVAPGVLGVDEVEVGDVVDQPPVGLLRHVLVEAAVAGLHVVDGDPHPLGHQRGDAAVGVAQDEDRVGSFREQHLARSRSASRRARDPARTCRRPSKWSGSRSAEVVEEHLVERVVVVLAGVHQHVVDALVQARDHPRQAG